MYCRSGCDINLFKLIFCVLQKMDESTRFLSATCDTFIKTLEECMSLSNVDVKNPLTPSCDTIVPMPNNSIPSNKKVRYL